MASRGEGTTITRRRHVLACARCRARRVKCDRAQPACSNCTKAGALCQPAQQQSTLSSSSMQSRTSRHGQDYTRLSKLEQEVARLSREVDSNSPSREPSLSPTPVDPVAHGEPGKLTSGAEPRYFSPFSWAVIAEELSDIDALLESSPQATGASGTSSTRASVGQISEPSLPDDRLHETLLNVYRHRVDPLIRILHWPTFDEKCRAFRRKRNAQTHASPDPQYAHTYYTGAGFDAPQQPLYPSTPVLPSQSHTPYPNVATAEDSDATFLGLLYSIYYAAAVSVADSPNPPNLGNNISAFDLAATFKREVTARVMSLGENAARLQSLQLLQAMVLVLSVDPDSFDVQLQWLQLGAALRMAQSLGVHRDGTRFDLKPVEIEVRRRLWAQLCILDVRYAEQLGCEPTIALDSYDSALPLSIDDRDLTEIEEQDAASKQGQETNFKAHSEIEYAQERQSPFSLMTLSLVEAEASRLLTQLLTVRYRPRDSAYQLTSSSPELGRRAHSTSRARSDKIHLVSKLEHRYQTVYGLGNSESTTSPMQYLVSEFAAISIAKAKFLNKMMEWKEGYSTMSMPSRDSEMIKLFRDAITVAHRVLSLIHQYANSPYSWYTKRFRDVYTASFLASTLASGQNLDQESINYAWPVLDQLFPIDSAGRFLEHSLPRSAFGQLLLKARMGRELQLRAAGTQGLREQAIQAAAGGEQRMFPTSMASHAAVTSAASAGAYQATGNMFDDFEMMQDPMWTPGLTGMEQPYGPWAVNAAQAPTLPLPLRQHSQHSQPFPRPVIQTTETYALPPTLSTPTPTRAHTMPATPTELRHQLLPSFHVEAASQMVLDESALTETPNGSPHLGAAKPPRGWPSPQGDLQVPRMVRERSVSQPQQPNFLNVEAHKLMRTKSMTTNAKPQGFPYGQYYRATSMEANMLPSNTAP